MNRKLLLGILVSLTLAKGTPEAHAADIPPLNTVPSSRELAGRPPTNFFWIRNNLQAAIDPVNGDLVFLDDSGTTIGRAKLPSGSKIDQVLPQVSTVLLIDTASNLRVIIPRQVDPTKIKQLVPAPQDRAPTSVPRIQRLDPKRVMFTSNDSQNEAPVTASALDGGKLMDLYPLGRDTAGNRFFGVEELMPQTGAINVHVSVQRFDNRGRINGYTRIPLEGMDEVPHGFLAVTDTGQVRILVPSRAGVSIIEQPIEPTTPVDAHKSPFQPTQSHARGLPNTVVKLKVHVVPVDNPSTSPAGGGKTKSKFLPTSIPRSQILHNADSFLHVNWTLQKENFSSAKYVSDCNKNVGHYWQRPSFLSQSSIGKTFSAMPYDWGGADSPADFLKKISKGALAGNVCTCRDPAHNDCQVPEAAGVDCSGFVSRAWGIPKKGTSALQDVTVAVSDPDSMKPGDIFLRAGHHVRLFLERTQGAIQKYAVLESATHLGCEGVCRSTYQLSELNQYTLRRYPGALDN